jgi:hypothetical protein
MCEEHARRVYHWRVAASTINRYCCNRDVAFVSSKPSSSWSFVNGKLCRNLSSTSRLVLDTIVGILNLILLVGVIFRFSVPILTVLLPPINCQV